jgi:ACS family D-galactonate transporter-like MFS transporter
MTSIPHTETPYRWYMLALAALTNAIGIAMPTMCLPVLFDEISRDLQLDLVQLGAIWGIGALPGIVTTLLGGAIGDRFGPKRILMTMCILSGLTGALRGVSNDFVMLAITSVMFGFIAPMIPMNGIKINSLWFPRHELGFANGVTSMGMALGFMLGSMISATVLSPLLGGWRNVLFLYGGLSIVLAIPWYFTRNPKTSIATGGQTSIQTALRHVVSLRQLWLFGLVIFGIGGSIQAVLGYLPLYLRGAGWQPSAADSVLSAFHFASMICVIPIALSSDRFGSRKKIVIASALMTILGFALLCVVQGAAIWAAVIIAGFVRDGFMAIFITMIMETEGVGRYAGTATGFVMVFSGLGNLFAPPLGNSLAYIAPTTPFVFWTILALVGLGGLCS